MPKLIYSPDSVVDLEEIWFYIAMEADVEIASRFVKKLEATCEKLLLMPLGYRLRPEFAPDLRSFPCGNYLIYYFAETYGVNVVRILHAARDHDAIFSE